MITKDSVCKVHLITDDSIFVCIHCGKGELFTNIKASLTEINITCLKCDKPTFLPLAYFYKLELINVRMKKPTFKGFKSI